MNQYKDLNPASEVTLPEGLHQTAPVVRTTHGGLIDLRNPNPDQLLIQDIAIGLSRIARFGGHGREFYSVAAHSINVAMQVPEKLRLQALMHDAVEAYMGDIVSPIKRNLPFFLDLEERMDWALAKKFGYQYPFSEEVKEADRLLLAAEYNWLFGDIEKPLCIIVRGGPTRATQFLRILKQSL